MSVVLFHYTVAFTDIYHHPLEVFSIFRYLRYGKHGVDLFFILSGFVIFMSLERTKNISDFVFNRFSRLYPTYWTAVVLSFVIVTIAGFPDLHIDGNDALVNLTMFQSFLNVPHIDGNYWTLEIELSFYLIAIVLHITKCLRKINVVIISWLLFISTDLLLNKFNLPLLPPSIRTFLILDYAHLFIIGIILYETLSTAKISFKQYFFISICLVISLTKSGEEYAIFALLFTTIFICILRGNLTFINHKYLLFLGSISYSLYLTHLNLGLVTIKTLENLGININICILFSLLTSILVANIITVFIERPAMKFMKDKYKLMFSNK